MQKLLRSHSVTVLGAAVAMAFAASAARVAAHHSVAGQFDSERRITLSGVISDIDWVNPHINLYLDQEEGGAVTRWRLVSVPPALMRRVGLSKEKLMAGGATVRVEAILARDGTPHLGWVLAIHYPDGYHYQLSTG